MPLKINFEAGMLDEGQGISVATAARLLGCSEAQIYRLREMGAIDGCQLASKGWWKIDRESVTKFRNFIVTGGSPDEWLKRRRDLHGANSS